MIFIPVSTYQRYKSYPFTYHMCAYLVQITVARCDAQPSTDVNYFKMYYVVVIMLRGSLQVLIIKYNHNNMVEMDMCKQNAFHWNISLQHHRQISIQLHHHVHVMQYSILFNLFLGKCYLYMDSRQSPAIKISSVEVDDHTLDICILQTFPYQMLWHKYDSHVASLYFYLFHICDVLFHQTF